MYTQHIQAAPTGIKEDREGTLKLCDCAVKMKGYIYAVSVSRYSWTVITGLDLDTGIAEGIIIQEICV